MAVEFAFRVPPRSDKYIDGIKTMYAQAYLNNGIYSSLAGRRAEALKYVQKALDLEPEYAQAKAWLERISAQ